MALHAAEFFTPQGNRLTAGSPMVTSPLTPDRVLERSIESRLPGIFEFDTVMSRGVTPNEVKNGEPTTHQTTSSGVGLILPLVAAGKLRSCVSLLWRTGADFAAALEVWRPDASGFLRLGDSFYGPMRAFEQVSRPMAFQVLEGLPGITFDAHKPVIFETLSKMRGFLRAEAATAAGLCVGLGIPVLDKKTATCAVLLLSSKRTPLARTFEVWLPDEGGARLASSQTVGPEAGREQRASSASLATTVIRSRMPQFDHSDGGLYVALPIFGGKAVHSVVLLGD